MPTVCPTLKRVKTVDYDERLYQVYSDARAVAPGAMAIWMAAFSRWLPDRRPVAATADLLVFAHP